MDNHDRSLRAHAATFMLLVAWIASCDGFAHGAGLMQAWPGGIVELREQNVRVEIEDGIAVTEVTQVFHNTEQRPVEAMYAFPLPPGASLADFTMWINGKEMVGEVTERQRARRIYESYKPVARDPGIVEKISSDIFEMRIFPIPADSDQKVRLRYYQELPRRGGRLTYVYPLRLDEKRLYRYNPAYSRQVHRFSLELFVYARGGLTAITSPTHAGFAARRQSGVYWRGGLEQARMDLDRDVVVELSPASPAPPVETVASRVGQAGGFFRLALAAPSAPPQERGQDFVFLVDVSGSMGDDGRLARTRRAVAALCERLGPADRFEIVAMRCDQLEKLFGRCEPPSADHLARARKFLDALKAQGSTWLCEGLAAARACARGDRALKIVLFSDGIFDLDPAEDILKNLNALPRQCRICFITLGDVGGFNVLQPLLRAETGWVEALPDDQSLEALLDRVGPRLRSPVLYEPAVAFDGVEVYDVSPARLPPMEAGDVVHVYGRYRAPGPLVVRLTGLMGSDPICHTSRTELPDQCQSKGRIERMWACRRVEDLTALAARQSGQEQQDTLWQIVRLGVAYSIVTDHTALLVLENDAEYKKWQLERANVRRLEFEREGGTLLRRQVEFLTGRADAATTNLRRQGQPLQPMGDAGPRGPTLQAVVPLAPEAQVGGGNVFEPELPKPGFCGTPKNFRETNLRPPYWRTGPRKILLAPGVTVRNVALNRPVTSSDNEPIIGELKMVTDGDKEQGDGSYVEVGPGRQWVQIDLGEAHLISFLLFWHHGYRVYHDVVVQLSDDPEFIQGVTTVFNNDFDNSSGLGVGTDMQYIENHLGEYVRLRKPLRARYVRLYSNGSSDNDQNHYTEVEVYAVSREQ